MSIPVHEDDKKPKKIIYNDLINPNRLNNKLMKYMEDDNISKYYEYFLKNIVSELKKMGLIKNQMNEARKMKQISDYFTYLLCVKASNMISNLYDNLETPSQIVIKVYRRIIHKKVDVYLLVESYQSTLQNNRMYMVCNRIADKALEEFPFEIMAYLAKK